ncbi:hypothetical protein [Hymenobacter elongatus]|uniref:DUF4625 domain-containing protein n=1 Tax=Hymenobacter elongatus TaxID=877208 RepID=A0A4Z0PPG8_9BACT|nr:hypothetical protein [Hymenobacter elongatus]TGE19252.1 hypothetical protein E5J99_03150 [Hymenobacter elongatus]
MKKIISHFLSLFVAVSLLAGCKEDEPDFNVTPKSSIVFDDNIDKATADFKLADNVAIRVGIIGSATSVRVTSNYSVGTTAKTKDLGTVAVSNGVAVFSVPSNSLRNSADGAIVGASDVAPTSSRPANTYNLAVDAFNPDGSSERRFFSAVIVR